MRSVGQTEVSCSGRQSCQRGRVLCRTPARSTDLSDSSSGTAVSRSPPHGFVLHHAKVTKVQKGHADPLIFGPTDVANENWARQSTCWTGTSHSPFSHVRNCSINASVTPAVAFVPNSLRVSPILPCHKSNCHQLVGAEVYDTAPDPATELLTRSHDIMYLLTCKLPASRSATVPAVP